MDINREVKLLISVIGILESLLNESISIDESEKLLFSVSSTCKTRTKLSFSTFENNLLAYSNHLLNIFW